MTQTLETKLGYVRAQAGLKLLDSPVVAGFDDPREGYLDLLTEDGRLRLTISRRIAEYLMIDLQQFLNAEPITTSGMNQARKQQNHRPLNLRILCRSVRSQMTR